jgi:peptide/nickel transport system ATP-binding protein
MRESILDIRDLCVEYVTDAGPVRAIDRVSLSVRRGEILGVAGESGSGKTTLAKAIMRILPPPAVITGGRVLFKGRDILDMDEDELRGMRWEEISMVFQSAMDALNPVISVGEQIVDTLMAHEQQGPMEDHVSPGEEQLSEALLSRGGGPSESPTIRVGDQLIDTLLARDRSSGEWAHERAMCLLDLVGIPRDRLDSFAHQLSGGMRQRVGIALALAMHPSVVILDEPTTALDVIVEREILERIRELQRQLNFAVIFITHDLARMLQVSDRVAVFYAARLAEVGPAKELKRNPRHPYTDGLLRAFPSVKPGGPEPVSIKGQPASLRRPPSGCRFHPRCPYAMDICREKQPDPIEIGPGHVSACYLAEKGFSRSSS